MGRGSLLVCRQLDHVATAGVECHHHLTVAAQAIDFEKHLIPGELGQADRQGIQVASMRTFDRTENAISYRLCRSHDPLVLLEFGRLLRNGRGLVRERVWRRSEGAAARSIRSVTGWSKRKERQPPSLER